jgi:hypothetical protein
MKIIKKYGLKGLNHLGVKFKVCLIILKFDPWRLLCSSLKKSNQKQLYPLIEKISKNTLRVKVIYEWRSSLVWSVWRSCRPGMKKMHQNLKKFWSSHDWNLWLEFWYRIQTFQIQTQSMKSFKSYAAN